VKCCSGNLISKYGPDFSLAWSELDADYGGIRELTKETIVVLLFGFRVDGVAFVCMVERGFHGYAVVISAFGAQLPTGEIFRMFLEDATCFVQFVVPGPLEPR
jgi:hypothetical protein